MSNTNELIPHEENHAEQIAEFFNSEERLKDPTQRRDYFESLDENGFLDLVQRVAGLVRTGKAEHQSFDGGKVGLFSHEVPDEREKEQLLRDTWVVAREFLKDVKISDQDALDYAAITVAGGILYAHPLADTNGRTGRTVSYAISRGNCDTQELRGILAKSDGGGNWQVTPISLVTDAKTDFKGPQPKQIKWEAAFVGEAEDALGGDIANSRYADMIIRSFIERHGDLNRRWIASSSSHSGGGSTLNGEEFIANLVNDPQRGIANATELLNIHRQVRADYVHRFLKAMQVREKYKPSDIRPKDFEITSKDDEFERRRKLTTIREVGERSVDGLLTPADQQLVQHRSYSRVRQDQDQKAA